MERKTGQPRLNICCYRPIIEFHLKPHWNNSAKSLYWCECRTCGLNMPGNRLFARPSELKEDAIIKFNFLIFLRDLPKREQDNKLAEAINIAFEPVTKYLSSQPPPSIFADITI